MNINERRGRGRNPYPNRGHNRGQHQHHGHNIGQGGDQHREQNDQDQELNHENQQQRRPQRRGFGFSRVYDFLSKTPDQVITLIAHDGVGWEGFLNSDALNTIRGDNFLVLVVQVIATKVCDKDVIGTQAQIDVILKSVGEKFRNRLIEKCNLNMTERPSRPNDPMPVNLCPLYFLSCLHTFYSFIAKTMKYTAKDFILNLVTPVITSLTMMEMFNKYVNSDKEEQFKKLFIDFKALTLEIKELIEKVEEPERRFNERRFDGFTELEENEMHNTGPPDDFRKIPIIPPLKELLSSEETFLRTNKKRGAYIDAGHYLDVQFRLMREDFVKPLKDGIRDFKKKKHEYLTGKKKMQKGNVRLYPGVEILKPELVRENLVFNVKLPDNQYKRIKWDKSKRLMNGSLLVFTTDDFEITAFFAVVIKRDSDILNKQGTFGITWEGIYPPHYCHEKKFLMIECEVYFEAYRHTLEILQHIELENFQHAKFIVRGSAIVDPPRYLLTSEDLMDIGIMSRTIQVSPLDRHNWPDHTEIGLDKNQYDAFRAALTNEISIIQGPPGTGKTFLGLQITKVLLQNTSIWNEGEPAPIFVVCYTNHALDQFLEGIIGISEKLFPNQNPKIIRVGGRSKNVVVSQFNIQNQHRNRNYIRDSTFYLTRDRARDNVNKFENERAENIVELNSLIQPEGIISFENLNCYEELRNHFPIELDSLLKDPHWYGFNIQVFYSKNFNEKRVFDQNFKLKPPIEIRAPYVTIKPQETPEDESDDEDYDLDELEANRIIEEAFDLKPSNINTNYTIKYCDMLSVKGCENQRMYEIRCKEVREKNSKISNQVKIEFTQEAERNIVKTGNSAKLLALIFDCWNNGTLDLPKLDDNWKNWNFLEIKIQSRFAIYFWIVERARDLTAMRISDIEKNLANAHKEFREARMLGDAMLLKQARVVGMTTTGAAKYNLLVKAMKSKIVIVEEAAEVLESHIVTCITANCQQLILIGDHQQLKPSTTVYDLSVKFNLDISLFERMLNNDLNCYRLKVQHRMRPEIADLVVGTIYNELENHPSVLTYPQIRGVEKSLFFIDHNIFEKSESDSMSKSNEHEAKFLAHFCRYLIQQGYSTDRITILTTYTGQMFAIKREMGKLVTCKGVRVTVVDNFQGEENDIILLSLVRSNEQKNIGFLKTDNRICVAISRAKHGLYIIGNMNNLNTSETWRKIKDKLEKRNEIDDKLVLVCQIHQIETSVKKSEDFLNSVPEGGCSRICEAPLECNHKCNQICHIADRDHVIYKCKEPCQKFCVNLHQCVSLCFQKCNPCNVKMNKRLPCGHDKIIQCHRNVNSVTCMEIMEKTLACGHVEPLPCHKNPTEYLCKILLEKTLKCGIHKKTLECNKDPLTVTCRTFVTKQLPCGHSQANEECWISVDKIRCLTEVEKTLPGCQHKSKMECHQKNNANFPCQSPCTTRLNCGHACTKKCHFENDPQHNDFICRKQCHKECENGHACEQKHECHLSCKPCQKDFMKKLDCGHETIVLCFNSNGIIFCDAPCERFLGCGHKCTGECAQTCPPCETLVLKKGLECSHEQMVKCSEPYLKNICESPMRPAYSSACSHGLDTIVPCKIHTTATPNQIAELCKEPCGFQFNVKTGGCDHKCKGNCKSCNNGRIHRKCGEKCGRQLFCGHVCNFPCSTNCPPCEAQCMLKCVHSECKNKCGLPCTNCAEPCSWRCAHKHCTKKCSEICDRTPCDEPCPKLLKCNHPCVGYCGEPCPQLCRICDNETLTEIFLGEEDEPEARFVLLEDCQHVIERTGMDQYIRVNIGEEIKAISCPKCKTVIRSSKRYGNLIKGHLRDIIELKKKIFGDEKQLTIYKEKHKMIQTLINDQNWIQILPELRNYLLEFLVHKFKASNTQNRKIDNDPKRVDINILTSINVVYAYGNETLKILAAFKAEKCEPRKMVLKERIWQQIIMKYDWFFELFMKCRLPLSRMETEDFKNEFSRINMLQKVHSVQLNSKFIETNATAVKLFNEILSIIDVLAPYNSKMGEAANRKIQELENLTKIEGIGISERELEDILNALQDDGISRGTGRWYKCPNGHFYAIGECGGAMQIGKCNECGAAIGGSYHRVLETNRFGGEIDGARRPLYPQ